jgi:hypothetical protein
LDASVGPDARGLAIAIAGDAASEWFDWAQLATSDDAMLLVHYWNPSGFTKWLATRPEAEKARVLDEVVTVLQRNVDNPDQTIRHQAVRRLLALERPDAIMRLLEHPMAKSQAQLFSKLRDLALPETIAPLAKLLKDPDADVRKMAEDALTSIQATLDKRKKLWDFAQQPR